MTVTVNEPGDTLTVSCQVSWVTLRSVPWQHQSENPRSGLDVTNHGKPTRTDVFIMCGKQMKAKKKGGGVFFFNFGTTRQKA